jgi:pimeloyl-ACP methyl ester carboxylesterase
MKWRYKPVTPQNSKARRQVAATVAVFALISGAPPTERSLSAQAEKQGVGRFTEQLVDVQSKDDILDAGALFAPPKDVAKPIAVIWIHGWGINFYSPTYVAISRALAKRGYTSITGNTRMHDLGNVEAWRGDKRIRGGGYWGVPSEEVRDIAAWIEFAGGLGFKRVVLVGHSAGATAVQSYQAQTQDTRVVGVALASGNVRPDTRVPPPELLAQAKNMIADGHSEDLVQGPFVSAATFIDIVNTPAEFKDFFGIQTPNPGVTRIHCPLLAFFGTNGDVGGDEELELLKSSIKHRQSGPSRVNTVMIHGADHMYAGQEDQVAEVIASWAGTLLPVSAGKGEVPKRQ